MRHFVTLFITLIVTLTPLIAGADVRSESLSFLRAWRKENTEKLNKASTDVANALKTVTDIKLKKEDGVDPMQKLNDRLTTLTENRNELRARDEFIDQLLFQTEQNLRVDSKSEVKSFLEETLLKLALQQTKSDGSSSLKDTRFFTNAVVALREVAEPNDPPLSFLKQYMEFSSVSNPKNPSQFAQERHYSNTSGAETSAPVSKEAAAEIAATVTTPPPPVIEAPVTEEPAAETIVIVPQSPQEKKPAIPAENLKMSHSGSAPVQ